MDINVSFYSNSLSYHDITSSSLRGTPGTIHMHGIIIKKDAFSQVLQVKVHTKVNTMRIGGIDRSMLHPSTRPIFQKTRMMRDQKSHKPNTVPDLGIGKMVNGFVYRQNFNIRTYEMGQDRKISIETLVSYLQETAINHINAIGLLGDGLGLSPEMVKKNLIWVMAKLQVVVDRYPIWGDVVQIDTWKGASGNIGMSSDWMVCDSKTGEILIRASCLWLMMNKETRKLAKFPDEVRAEFDQYLIDTPSIVKQDTPKWSKRDKKIADNVCNGLMPIRGDLDINQHVNNAKYVGWILESVPGMIERNYELASISLEYCRECRKDSVLKSHTYVIECDNGEPDNYNHVDCEHLLQLEIGNGGGEIMKGRTRWRPKYGKGSPLEIIR